jgi:proteasome lid subunit RPN8/RPN11
VLVLVAQSVALAVHTHMAAAPQREQCGALIGYDVPHGIRIIAFCPLDNVAESPENTFFINQTDIFSLQRTLRQLNGARRQDSLRMVGHVHSHPNSPNIPSETDRAFMADALTSGVQIGAQIWGIVAVMQGKMGISTTARYYRPALGHDGQLCVADLDYRVCVFGDDLPIFLKA